MGKTIIQQARGHGSLTYRVRRKAFVYRIKYPLKNIEGEAIILKLIHSTGHSAPLSKIKIKDEIFYNPATLGIYEGQKIILGSRSEIGDIARLKDIPPKTQVYNIESHPGDGGKIIRTAGSSAIITKKEDNGDHNKIIEEDIIIYYRVWNHIRSKKIYGFI